MATAEESEVIIEKLGTDAPPPGDAPETELPELDYEAERPEGDTPAEEPEGAPAGDVEEPDTGTPIAEPPVSQALLDRLDQVQRIASEAQAELQRLRDGGLVAKDEDVPEAPPKPRDQLTTAQDVLEYVAWENRFRAKHERAQRMLEATAVASEQYARGILSGDKMGSGYDYDSMINRYVSPIERLNPAFRIAMSQMRDPAVARYSIAFFMEALEKFGGDPARTFKEMRSALNGRAVAGKDIVQRIQKAEKSGAAKVRMKARQPGARSTPNRLGPQEIKEMSNSDFIKLRNRMYQQNR